MNTITQTNAPKLAIIDNAINFLSPLEVFVEKLVEVAGNEPARPPVPSAAHANP